MKKTVLGIFHIGLKDFGVGTKAELVHLGGKRKGDWTKVFQRNIPMKPADFLVMLACNLVIALCLSVHIQEKDAQKK